MSDPIESFNLETDTGWTLAEGSIEDKPMLVRIRESLGMFVANPRWPRRLVIEWEFEQDNTSGMPPAELSSAMAVFEDAIVPALEQDKFAILAFVFTCDGLRHWHFYFSEAADLGERVNAALAEHPAFPIQLVVEDDPDWTTYLDVRRGAGMEDSP